MCLRCMQPLRVLAAPRLPLSRRDVPMIRTQTNTKVHCLHRASHTRITPTQSRSLRHVAVIRLAMVLARAVEFPAPGLPRCA